MAREKKEVKEAEPSKAVYVGNLAWTTEAPAPQTEDAVSTLLSAAAFAVARHIQTLGEGEGAATLEMDCPRAPTVCPCVNGSQCTLGRAGHRPRGPLYERGGRIGRPRC